MARGKSFKAITQKAGRKRRRRKRGKSARKSAKKTKKPRKKKRKMNAYFKLMLAAKKKRAASFKYKGKTYKGVKHHRLGMIYKKA